MSADKARSGWSRWREVVFATCTAWLVLQNVALLALVAWCLPASALAASAAFAKTAVTMSGPLLTIMVAVALGLALAAYLVHAPAAQPAERAREVNDERR
jgi:uncharacterized membrane protein YwzB